MMYVSVSKDTCPFSGLNVIYMDIVFGRDLLPIVHLKFSEPRNVEYNVIILLICDENVV